MKKHFLGIFRKLGVLFLLNVATILVYLLAVIFFKIPVMSELSERLFDKNVLNTVLYAVYCVSYYLIFALTIFKNSSAKRDFLNATAESGYTLSDGVTDYLKNYFMSDLRTIVLMAVISYALLGPLGHIGFIRIVFLPQYALAELFGIGGASVIYLILTLVLNFVFTVSALYIWDKNRLGGRSDG